MINRKTASIATILAAASAGVIASASGSSNADAPRFASGGTYESLLGTTPEGPIFGYPHSVLIPSLGGREPIGPANQPARLHPDLRGRIMRLGTGPEAGESDHPIFPSSWWPMVDNGISFRYNSNVRNFADWTTDPDNLSPSEKYDRLIYPGQTQRLPEVRNYTPEELNRPAGERGQPHVAPAINVIGPTTSWELANHGVYQKTYPEDWWGHCNGWSASVTAEREGAPLRDIRVRRGGRGEITECSASESGCILFRTVDIEALLSEVYFHDASTISGRRCNTEPADIERDAYGRPKDPVCRDLNPATMHVALTGLLGIGVTPLSTPGAAPERLPFVVDYAYHNEVWTFPVVQYKIDEIESVDEDTAIDLVCKGTSGANCDDYPFNENARRFARVKTRFWVVGYATTGRDLLTPPLNRERNLLETSIHYVLELDGRSRILGGEWIESPRTVTPDSKELHPDFLFMSVYPNASDEQPDDRGGKSDNPYLSYNDVKALLRISRTGAGRGR
jgi:hypothetical protein